MTPIRLAVLLFVALTALVAVAWLTLPNPILATGYCIPALVIPIRLAVGWRKRRRDWPRARVL